MSEGKILEKSNDEEEEQNKLLGQQDQLKGIEIISSRNGKMAYQPVYLRQDLPLPIQCCKYGRPLKVPFGLQNLRRQGNKT